MSSDSAETVKRSRELMDSGIDPMALMSQLAGLIMDIIAGTYKLADSSCNGSVVGGRSCRAIASIAFDDCGIESRAQRFLSSITNSIETVLKCNVEVKMGPLAELIDGELMLEAGSKVGRVESDVLSCSSNSDRLRRTVNSSKRSFDHPDEGKKELEKYKSTPCADETMQSVVVTSFDSGMPKARGLEVPTQATKEPINGEQKLESAWLQVSEKHSRGLMNQVKHGHHVLSQVVDSQYQRKSSMSLVVPSSHADEDLAHEIEALRILDSYGSQKHQSGRGENGFAISPSRLHRKDDMADCDKDSVYVSSCMLL
nr:unnamed protein product [Digitaria exilis]